MLFPRTFAKLALVLPVPDFEKTRKTREERVLFQAQLVTSRGPCLAGMNILAQRKV